MFKLNNDVFFSGEILSITLVSNYPWIKVAKNYDKLKFEIYEKVQILIQQ